MCASTGNTSASAAAYACRCGLKCYVLIPEGKIAKGKLLQAYRYGAKVIMIEGNFDKALELVKEITAGHGGSVTFESTEGAGTEFVLHIPKEPVLAEHSSVSETAERADL